MNTWKRKTTFTHERQTFTIFVILLIFRMDRNSHQPSTLFTSLLVYSQWEIENMLTHLKQISWHFLFILKDGPYPSHSFTDVTAVATSTFVASSLEQGQGNCAKHRFSFSKWVHTFIWYSSSWIENKWLDSSFTSVMSYSCTYEAGAHSSYIPLSSKWHQILYQRYTYLHQSSMNNVCTVSWNQC